MIHIFFLKGFVHYVVLFWGLDIRDLDRAAFPSSLDCCYANPVACLVDFALFNKKSLWFLEELDVGNLPLSPTKQPMYA